MIAIKQINQGHWCQETYETSAPGIRKRAADLRKRGYRVTVSSMGNQVTRYGIVKLTMLTILPGAHQDTFGLPEIKIKH